MIAIGYDSAGADLAKHIKKYLVENKLEFKDFSEIYMNLENDYPDFANMVAKSILKNESEKGILICGTGIGISIAANRHRGIRCALCHDTFSAKSTREHNDSNILAMGGRVISYGLALEILHYFLTTDKSEDERHRRRIKKIDNI